MHDDRAVNNHFNLYYIFKEDKENHPLSTEKVERLRNMLFDKNGSDP